MKRRAKKKLISVRKSRTYVKWTEQRNRALESILNLYLGRVDDVVRQVRRTCVAVTHYYLVQQTASNYDMHELRPVFEGAANDTVELIRRLRVTTRLIAYLGEFEALTRVTNTRTMPLGYQHHAAVQWIRDQDSRSGGSLPDRIRLYYRRLFNHLADRVHVAKLADALPESAEDIVRRAFPKATVIKRPPRRLRPVLKEAGKVGVKITAQPDFNVKVRELGLISDEDWDALVNDYLDAQGIANRGTDTVADTQTVDEFQGKPRTREKYVWEVEREVNEDFVQQVRDGSVEAAQEAGIAEFEWVAIIDDKTCEDCCQWRDGLSTTEIEDALQGEHSDDDCQATVAPAHFHCRCDNAPMIAELADNPREDLGDFDQWLK